MTEPETFEQVVAEMIQPSDDPGWTYDQEYIDRYAARLTAAHEREIAEKETTIALWHRLADMRAAGIAEKDALIALLEDMVKRLKGMLELWPRKCACDAPAAMTEEVTICGGCGGYRA